MSFIAVNYTNLHYTRFDRDCDLLADFQTSEIPCALTIFQSTWQ
jgi:hypothetical protein